MPLRLETTLTCDSCKKLIQARAIRTGRRSTLYFPDVLSIDADIDRDPNDADAYRAITVWVGAYEGEIAEHSGVELACSPDCALVLIRKALENPSAGIVLQESGTVSSTKPARARSNKKEPAK